MLVFVAVETKQAAESQIKSYKIGLEQAEQRLAHVEHDLECFVEVVRSNGVDPTPLLERKKMQYLPRLARSRHPSAA